MTRIPQAAAMTPRIIVHPKYDYEVYYCEEPATRTARPDRQPERALSALDLMYAYFDGES